MRTALLIAAKDARQRMRDRSVFLFALVVPLALAFMFSLIFGGAEGPGGAFEYAVVDADGGAVAEQFTDEVLPAVASGGAITVQTVDSVAQGRALVEQGEVDAVFVIPAGFSAAAQSSQPAQLQIIGDVDETFGVQVARAIAESYTAELDAVRLSVATALAADGGDAAQLAQQAQAQDAPVRIAGAATADRQLDTTTYLSAGMAVFFLFFTVQFGVTSLLDERRQGTMARLLAAPVGRGGILAGKLLVSFGVGVVSMGMLAFGTSVLLGARWGDPVGVAMLVVAGVMAATGVMAVVASLARTSEQAGTWQSIIAVVMGALGGAFFPIQQTGGAIAALSYVTPHRWFMQGLADLSGGGGAGVVLPATGAMLLFAVVTGGIAALRIGKVVRP